MSSKDPLTKKFCAVATVTILVGKNKKPFQVHQDRLCEASSFFKAAFEGCFRESSEKKMDLPEEDEHLFELFVQWLYYRRYEIPPQEAEGWVGKFMEPVKLYVLADKYDVGDLRSHLIARLFEIGKRQRLRRRVPSLATMACAFDHVSPKSGLRRLLADWYACTLSPSLLSSEDAQKWLQEHPQVAAAMVSSFAMTAPRATQIDPFAGEMPERYRENVQQAPE